MGAWFKKLLLMSLLAAPLALAAEPEQTGEECLPDLHLIAGNGLNVAVLKGDLQNYKPTTVAQNRQYVRFATTDVSGQHLYFHAENSVLKPLNDDYLEDRELSQALTNFYKRIFFENLSESPLLSGSLIGEFSDYKTIRLIFEKDDRQTRRELEKVYQKTAEEFRNRVAVFKEVADLTAKADHPLVPDHRLWHQSGIGHHADEAGWSSRYARKEAGETKVPTTVDFRDPKTLEVFLDSYTNTEVRRRAIEKELGENKDIMEPLKEGDTRKVLTRDALEILRRVHPVHAVQDIPYVIHRFEERFGVKLTPQQAALLIEYVHHIDRFVPNINVDSHDPMSLGEAEFGFVALDLAGQNVRNLDAAMHALAQTMDSKPEVRGPDDLIAFADHILKQLRLGQDGASEEFSTIQRIVAEAFKRLGVKGDPVFSKADGIRMTGDDIVFAPERPLTRKEYARLLDILAELGVPKDYRITFGPSFYRGGNQDAIRENDRAALVVSGDTIEKELRKALEHDVAYEDLKGIIIGVEMLPDQKGHTHVKLIVGGRIPPGLLAKIRQHVPGVLKKVSAENNLQLEFQQVESTSSILRTVGFNRTDGAFQKRMLAGLLRLPSRLSQDLPWPSRQAPFGTGSLAGHPSAHKGPPDFLSKPFALPHPDRVAFYQGQLRTIRSQAA